MFLFLSLLSCIDYELDENVDVDDNPIMLTPDIEVTPSVINFGNSQVSDKEKFEHVTIRNVGESTLNLRGFSLYDSYDNVYTLQMPPLFFLEPGEYENIKVYFEPEGPHEYPSAIEIESNDPDESTVSVELIGAGIAPELLLTPKEYSFGDVGVGCKKSLEVEIVNVGNSILNVTGFNFLSPSYELESEYPYPPWALSPGDIVPVWIDYEPEDESADISFIKVYSDDPKQDIALGTYSGQGVSNGKNIDIYETPIESKVDIIFALDWSCSMNGEIQTVTNNFENFITSLAATDADYRISAIIKNDGCVLGSDLYLDNSMSLHQQLDIWETVACVNPSGASCAYEGNLTEKAFMLWENAFSPANLTAGGCNEGLIRSDARLALVGVSDEKEQSVSPYHVYVNKFQSLKQNPTDVVFHAIGGDYPSGCAGAQFYANMYDATVMTSGLFLSICTSNFSNHLKQIAKKSSAGQMEYELSELPVENSIEVYIDGIQQLGGWTYNQASNSIIFGTDYIPDGGSVIEIEYYLYVECDE